MNFLKFRTLVLSLAVIPFFVACSDDDDDNNTPSQPASMSIADVASNDGRFTILLDALGRTGLDATLDGAGSFTVFAPTDDAFTNLLGTIDGVSNLDELEAAIGTDGLRQVLLYHVLGSEVMSADIAEGYVKTLAERVAGNGEYLDSRIYLEGGMVKLNNGVTVSTPDVDADNGVIHVVEDVIMPMTVADAAVNDPAFSELVTALTAADGDGDGTGGDLVPVLDNASSVYTVFAPTNQAFVDAAPVASQLTPAQLADVLLYHVVSGANVTSSTLTAGAVTSAEGSDFTVNLGGSVTLTDETGNTINVVSTDVQMSNGVIHVIDRVMVPVF